jgi:hypothetical protein
MLAPLPETCMTLTREMQEKFPDIKLTRMMGNSVPQPWVMGIYGQSAEVELIDLLYCFVRLLKPRTVVELGCHLGLTTYALGRAAQDNGSECAPPRAILQCGGKQIRANATILLVDHNWKGRTFPKTKPLTESLERRNTLPIAPPSQSNVAPGLSHKATVLLSPDRSGQAESIVVLRQRVRSH